MDSTRSVSDAEIIRKMQWMNSFMNERYDRLKNIWIEYDVLSIQAGILLTFHLILFHQYLSFSRSQYYQDVGGIVGLSVSFTSYVGALLDVYPLWASAVIVFIISSG